MCLFCAHTVENYHNILPVFAFFQLNIKIIGLMQNEKIKNITKSIKNGTACQW